MLAVQYVTISSELVSHSFFVQYFFVKPGKRCKKCILFFQVPRRQPTALFQIGPIEINGHTSTSRTLSFFIDCQIYCGPCRAVFLVVSLVVCSLSGNNDCCSLCGERIMQALVSFIFFLWWTTFAPHIASLSFISTPTGWLRKNVYGTSATSKCSGTPITTTFTQFGVCGSTDGKNYYKIVGTTYVNSTVNTTTIRNKITNVNTTIHKVVNTTIVQLNTYIQNDCTSQITAVKGPFNTSYCYFVDGSYTTFKVVPKVTLPISSNTQGQYFYTTQRACTSATITSLFAVMFSPVGCTPQGSSGAYYGVPVCASNGTIISKTGGFLALQYYPTSLCDGSPTSTSFVQLNVCGSKRSPRYHAALHAPLKPTHQPPHHTHYIINPPLDQPSLITIPPS